MTHFETIFRDHQPKKRGPKPKVRPEPPMIPCACGCGILIRSFSKDWKPRRFKLGHAGNIRAGTPQNWKKDQIQVVKNLWGKESAKTIGEMLGLTKSAVIGKAHRLNLPKLQSPIRPAMSPEERKARVRESDRKRRIRMGSVPRPKRALKIVADNSASNQRKPVQVRKVARPMVDPLPTRNILIGDVTRETCAFPTSTERGNTHSGLLHKMCGHAVEEGKPYCGAHMALAYIPKGEQGIKDLERLNPDKRNLAA